MDPRIETRPETPLIARRHVGPFEEIGPDFEALFAALKAAGIAPQGPMIGLYHDDPRTTPAAELRSDACVAAADPPAQLPGGLAPARLPAGRWAVHVHAGPYEGLSDAWMRFYESWLPTSGETHDDSRPAVEIYVDDPASTPPETVRTEMLMPLRGDQGA